MIRTPNTRATPRVVALGHLHRVCAVTDSVQVAFWTFVPTQIRGGFQEEAIRRRGHGWHE